MRSFAAACCVVLVLTLAAVSARQPSFDVVLAGGRVVDPATNLDAVRHVGIRDGRIEAVSAEPLTGRTTVDVSGLVVAPGFIDLHQHAQDLTHSRLQVQDGVTTALEMEIGVLPVDRWYAGRAGASLNHYGATVSHISARVMAKTGASTLEEIRAVREKGSTGAPPAWSHALATPDEIDAMVKALEAGLDAGGLGLGLGINYTPGARRDEILRLFQLAVRRKVPLYIHIRGMGRIEPGGSIDSLQEVLANAAATGASLHVVHLGSMGLSQAPTLLEMIKGARARGLDLTTEVYPYTAGSTFLQSAIFDDGWQDRLGITFKDVQWSATGERLDREMFARRRREGGLVVIHMIPEETVDMLVADPLLMIASDGVPLVNGGGHPRGAGTYARVLGRYVREGKALSLMDALRKMTIMPAERVQAVAPMMARKGRVSVGADADLTVFDAATVIDRATYQNPAQASAGIKHVLVGGTFVVREARVVEGVAPGRPIRR